jgi:hypothetical protein
MDMEGLNKMIRKKIYDNGSVHWLNILSKSLGNFLKLDLSLGFTPDQLNLSFLGMKSKATWVLLQNRLENHHCFKE